MKIHIIPEFIQIAESTPDTPHVEEGAKGIPWIASPIPAFRSWNAGGIISESSNEWHLHLMYLVEKV